MTKISSFITRYITLWIVLSAVVGFFLPGPFMPYGKTVPYFIGLIMLGMGLTMTFDDFKLVLSNPKDVFYGVALRYLIMPCVAFAVAKILALPPALAAGVILVGCCPSGAASNVMTFIGKGDTALSLTVSSVNTILGIFITPYAFLLLAGSFIPIDATALLVDILKIVLAPVLIGLAIRSVATKLVLRCMPIIPLISVFSMVAIILIVVALNAGKLATVATIAFIAVIAHNSLGLALGYGASRGLGMSHHKSKAICFEIGMENSGLAVALAVAHLDPIAAIPGAIFSVWHNISGSILAAYWARKDSDPEVANAAVLEKYS